MMVAPRTKRLRLRQAISYHSRWSGHEEGLSRTKTRTRRKNVCWQTMQRRKDMAMTTAMTIVYSEKQSETWLLERTYHASLRNGEELSVPDFTRAMKQITNF